MQEYINKFWSLLFCESSLLHCKKKLMSLPTLNNLYTLLSASSSIMNALYSWQVEDSVHKVWYTFLMEFHLLLSYLPTNCQLVCHSSSVKFYIYIFFFFRFLTGLHVLASMLSYFSHIQRFVSLWTVAHQVPLSLELKQESRQEHEWIVVLSSRECSWSSDGTLCLKSPALAGGFFTFRATWEGHMY